jgi:tetratricopeptide (TPR) repeat protein
MKKNIVIISIIFMSINFFADDQSLFQQAQNEFAQEKWEESLSIYQKIENKNSLVWQNIATCLFHLEQYPQALVAAQRAFFGVSFAQFYHLENLEKKINTQLHLEQKSDFYFVARKILYYIPLLLLQIIFLVILIQIFLMFLRRWKWDDFTRQEKRFLKKLIIILLVCMALWYAKTLFFLNDKAIVIKSNAMVYAGPDESFHDFEKLQPGIEVKIIKKQKNMYHIQTQTFSGWVNADILEPIINHE